MTLIIVLVLFGLALAWTPLRKALPFESLLAVGMTGIACVVLFQMGKLG